METLLTVLATLLGLSLAANAALALKLSQFKKHQKYTYDARQLVHDLTVSSAIVEIKRIDPAQIFLRSPK